MTGAALTLSALLAALPAAPPAAAPYTVALVVGLNTSRDPGVAPLKYADDDAARYFELFSETVAHASLLAVLDEDSQRRHPQATSLARPPTRAALEEAVADAARRLKEAASAGRPTELVFIYAGHGAVTPEGEGYLNLVDGKLLRRELFSLVLDKVPARVKHVIIDACDAYLVVARRGGPATEAEKAALKAFLDRDSLEGHPEVGVLVSGSKEVDTHEWSALEAGVFSHEVRSALLGAADADGDGLIRYAEVAAFAAAANDGLVDPRARVEVFAHPPAVDLASPLMDLRRGRRRYLEVPAELKGRFHVEDARGARYADFHASGEEPVRLRLVGLSDYFVEHDGAEARAEGGAEGVAVLSAKSFGEARASARGAVEDAQRKGLFAVAYGKGFLRGYVAREPGLGALPPPGDAFGDAGLLRTEVRAPATGFALKKAGWASLIVAAALGVASGVAAVQTRGGYDDFLTRFAAQGTYDPKQVKAIEDWRLATNLLLAGAVTTGAVGGLLLWRGDSRASASVAFLPDRGVQIVVVW